jgi:cell division protease FtsH
MDGFTPNTSVVVIAATNRPDILDPALTRAGRFDRKIMVGRPTYEERLAILKYYLKDKKVTKEVDIEGIARRISGFVGADIENVVNEASLKIAKDTRKEITPQDFEYALEKHLM